MIYLLQLKIGIMLTNSSESLSKTCACGSNINYHFTATYIMVGLIINKLSSFSFTGVTQLRNAVNLLNKLSSFALLRNYKQAVTYNKQTKKGT